LRPDDHGNHLISRHVLDANERTARGKQMDLGHTRQKNYEHLPFLLSSCSKAHITGQWLSLIPAAGFADLRIDHRRTRRFHVSTGDIAEPVLPIPRGSAIAQEPEDFRWRTQGFRRP
jgi:hypothetical protein